MCCSLYSKTPIYRAFEGKENIPVNRDTRLIGVFHLTTASSDDRIMHIEQFVFSNQLPVSVISVYIDVLYINI